MIHVVYRTFQRIRSSISFPVTIRIINSQCKQRNTLDYANKRENNACNRCTCTGCISPRGNKREKRTKGGHGRVPTGSISILYNPAMPPTNGVLNNLSTRVEKGAIEPFRVPEQSVARVISHRRRIEDDPGTRIFDKIRFPPWRQFLEIATINSENCEHFLLESRRSTGLETPLSHRFRWNILFIDDRWQ